MTAIDEQRPSVGRGRARTVITWLLQILGAAAFVAAGGSKLAGLPQMVGLFDQIGIGQWFRIVTGLLEVMGGLMLLVPGTATYGGVMLALIMAAAAFTHVAVIGGNPVPALVLLAVTAAVAWLRRGGLHASFAPC